MKTLTAFYDLAVGPVSYDFVVFGIQAKMAAARSGCVALHIVIVPDSDHYIRPKPKIYSFKEAIWRLWNIVIPACQLMGSTVTLAQDWEHAKRIGAGQECWPEDWDRQSLERRHHLVGGVLNAIAAGERFTPLRASEFALGRVRKLYEDRKVVTMTLRKTYLPDRNSDEATWEKARNHIVLRGYRVHQIADTATALAQGNGFAELNLDLRMACYQEAALNLQSNNGAASLCWFSDKPYRMFGCGDEHWDGLFVKQGLPLGASWPWARPQQKLCYGKETAAQIIEEFEVWATATN